MGQGSAGGPHAVGRVSSRDRSCCLCLSHMLGVRIAKLPIVVCVWSSGKASLPAAAPLHCVLPVLLMIGMCGATSLSKCDIACKNVTSQVESYNEAMKGEIAVTRRAAYAAEAAVGRLEKEKLEQDFRWGLGNFGF